MELLDTLSDWVMDGNLLLIGGVLLLATLIISFFLKTSWGQWKWGKQDKIYGKPGANIKKKKQLHEQE